MTAWARWEPNTQLWFVTHGSIWKTLGRQTNVRARCNGSREVPVRVWAGARSATTCETIDQFKAERYNINCWNWCNTSYKQWVQRPYSTRSTPGAHSLPITCNSQWTRGKTPTTNHYSMDGRNISVHCFHWNDWIPCHGVCPQYASL